MAAVEYKSSLPLMIEIPCFPAACVVTKLAFSAEGAFVDVVTFVAAGARHRRVFECGGFMARLAG